MVEHRQCRSCNKKIKIYYDMGILKNEKRLSQTAIPLSDEGVYYIDYEQHIRAWLCNECYNKFFNDGNARSFEPD